MLRALLVFGTRPEAVKMAPIVHECMLRPAEIEPVVCCTGQHRELLFQATQYFELRCEVELHVMRPDQSPAEVAARALAALDDVLHHYQPQCVAAQGDTTTVLAASLAAFYRRVPFVHVEAGLRTGNLAAPFPEEFNRRVASLAAALHCAPTAWAAQNLIREGAVPARVHVTGNTVVDALLWTLQRERCRQAYWRDKYAFLGGRPLVLITSHRRESFGPGMERICTAISRLAAAHPEVEYVYPVHLNPRVCHTVQALLRGRPNIHLLPPLPYPEFVWLMDRATVVLTDSGGVQEEAPSLGKPVVVMRETTERPEAVHAGLATLVGTHIDRIVAAVSKHLQMPRGESNSARPNPFGDGRAARRIVDLMVGRAWDLGPCENGQAATPCADPAATCAAAPLPADRIPPPGIPPDGMRPNLIPCHAIPAEHMPAERTPASGGY